MGVMARIALLDADRVRAEASLPELVRLVGCYQSEIGSVGAAEHGELAAVGAMHSWPWIRVSILNTLARRFPKSAETRELARWLTHDYEDLVAFDAIRLCGLLRIWEALPDLIPIVGSVRSRLSGRAGKPVGVGHAVVLQAIVDIIDAGRKDLGRIAELEAEIFAGGTVDSPRPVLSGGRSDAPATTTTGGGHDHRDMCAIPAGTVRMGRPAAWAGRVLQFDWQDDPVGEIGCPAFAMDRQPVTVAEYDRFAGSEPARTHRFCHPSEIPDKIHWRNTVFDARVGPEHPVTGVDWFDAYAYARWRGKRLPSEAEWQRAAQGADGRAYPWGEEFDAVQVHCLPQPSTDGWPAIEDWRETLGDLVRRPAWQTTRPVAPTGASPFGVYGLSGNTWEWTSSSYFGGPATPGSGSRDALDVVYDDSSYAVIKGGAWTSLPEQTSAAFRGRDLLFDRHFEIGFRCVCDCRPPATCR
ncbi:MAG TPA: SUMF1/EgtB/PvdO family nonheme iron enzyme [Mycobacteriales bacterium]|nr:SUMF1/EgtB/PvdO family nonheme iron enzyme [Mycobacteriales bacterium]